MRPGRRACDLRRCRADLQGIRVLHHRLREGRERPAQGEGRRCIGGGRTRAEGRVFPGALEAGSPDREKGKAGQEEGTGVTDTIRAELARVADILGAGDAPFVLERPREPEHGDLATNLALLLARSRRANPRRVAEEVVAALAFPDGVVERVEIAGPGFINFWLAGDQLATALRDIVRAGERFGRSETGRGVRVNVEFVSANPTGPLHVGHGRGAALGDGLAALLEWTGHEVIREFYINDAGVQIDHLVASLWARMQQRRGGAAGGPEGGYHGED